jgi:hydrogenase maturation factor
MPHVTDRLEIAAAAYREAIAEEAEAKAAMQEAQARRAAAGARVMQARAPLAEAIVEAARAGRRQVEIARVSGYNREHIRRICRAAGIEPAE